jgi:hypothetical protein
MVVVIFENPGAAVPSRGLACEAVSPSQSIMIDHVVLRLWK